MLQLLVKEFCGSFVNNDLFILGTYSFDFWLLTIYVYVYYTL